MGTLRVGRYELSRLLGEGGMGSVYEARDVESGRSVAVKLITADVSAHPTVLTRFDIEARAASAIRSPHIAEVIDFGKERGAPFLVMELIRGSDLEAIFGKLKVLPEELVVRMGAQCCAGLARAHERGVVHRDIKPANLILAEQEGSDELVLKILDFGIAKVMAEEFQALGQASLTRTGSLVGSPRYMSPEQARGYKTIDQRTDLFSLAVVMYQALTGTTPHHQVEAMGDLLVTLCSEKAQPVRMRASWVDARLEAILAKALAIEANERYASAAEMERELRALIRGGHAIRRDMVRTFEPPPVPSSMPTMIRTTADLPARPSAPSPSPAATMPFPPQIAPSPTRDSLPGVQIAAANANSIVTRTEPAAPARMSTVSASDAQGGESGSIVWVGAGIALSLFVGIVALLTGVLPLPSRSKPAASAAVSAAASPPPAATTSAPMATTPTAAASSPPPPIVSASASAAPSASAKPALTGRMPTAAPVVSTPPPPAVPTTHLDEPPPPKGPANPTDL